MSENNTYYYEERRGRTAKSAAKAGISFGSALAMVVSYTAWQSIPWAIFHGLLGWVYVVYYLIKY